MLARVLRAIRRRRSAATIVRADRTRAAALGRARASENERALTRVTTARLRHELGMPPL